MKIRVRPPNTQDLDEKGIPIDFVAVMKYFNESLTNNSLPWIPRKTPITTKEIENEWIPSLKRNIVVLAESQGNIIGSATIFYDPKSTAYEHANHRRVGEMASTIDPSYTLKQQIEIQEALVKGCIEELKAKEKAAFLRVAKESPMAIAMQNLEYVGKQSEADHYKEAGLSGIVFEYELP